eukprot:gene379-639_t
MTFTVQFRYNRDGHTRYHVEFSDESDAVRMYNM